MAKAQFQNQQKAQLVDVYRKALLMQSNLEQLDDLVTQELQQVEKNKLWHTADANVDKKTVADAVMPKVFRYGSLIVPAVCLIVGIYLIGSAAFPIASAYWSGEGEQNELISIIPDDRQLDSTPIQISQVITQNDPVGVPRSGSPRILDINLDYTNLANWFGGETLPELAQAAVVSQEYRIDIPKLNVENATVVQGGTDLNKSLIAYPGTALPGQFGAPVIFGHSVLRQFYNPSEKNSRRYNSIFSTIMTLKNGDEIFVTHDGIRYTYVVREKTEVKPTDVYILNQKRDAKRLKLVTCTPEGTYLRRGVITAELVSEVPL